MKEYQSNPGTVVIQIKNSTKPGRAYSKDTIPTQTPTLIGYFQPR